MSPDNGIQDHGHNEKTNQRRITVTKWKEGLSGLALAAAMLGAITTSALADAGELHIYNWTD